MLFDTHAHLYDDQFEADLDEVIFRANDAGIRLIVAVGVDLESSRHSLRIAQANDGIYAAVGIHPNSADRATPEALAEIRTLASDPRVVGIGETGLDYYRERVEREVQRRVLDAHLALAAELDKPVIIHDRDAHDDIAAVALGWGRRLGGSIERPVGVLHCFTGDLALAAEAISAGFLISFAGNVTYRRAESLAAVAAAVDLRAVVLETDCPWLAPTPLRGRRNEPANLAATADRLASARGLTVAQIGQETTANARRLFRL